MYFHYTALIPPLPQYATIATTTHNNNNKTTVLLYQLTVRSWYSIWYDWCHYALEIRVQSLCRSSCTTTISHHVPVLRHAAETAETPC
jgi:hypothetical protein